LEQPHDPIRVRCRLPAWSTAPPTCHCVHGDIRTLATTNGGTHIRPDIRPNHRPYLCSHMAPDRLAIILDPLPHLQSDCQAHIFANANSILCTYLPTLECTNIHAIFCTDYSPDLGADLEPLGKAD